MEAADQLWTLLESFGVTGFLVEILQTDFAKMTIAFTIAARFHRRWVKKDTAEQFLNVTKAIDNVAAMVSKDLAAHTAKLGQVEEKVSVRLGQVEEKVNDIHNRVEKLEKP
jgi:hypothetical protein